MGTIKNYPNKIQVLFTPDEIISERIGFAANTVSKLGSAIAFCAKQKLVGTALENIKTGETTIAFEKGHYVVTMIKE